MVTPLPPDCESPRGGVEAVSVCLIEALARLDVRVTVIQWGGTEDAPYRHPRLDCTVVPLRLRHPAVIGNWLWTPRELGRIVSDVQPDVVHVQDIPEFGLALDVPRALTIHGINPRDEWVNGGPRRYLTWPILATTFARAVKTYPHVISISPYVRRAVRFAGHTVVHDVDNPVEDAFFEVSPDVSTPTVLTVGLLSKLKNTLGLVQVASRVRQRVPGVRFRIVGPWREGSQRYRRSVERFCERGGLHDTVHFVGRVDREAILSELAGASCLALPSFQENAPRVIAEAMAAGLPVAASSVGGIPWMVSEGKTGLLFDPNRPDQMVDALVRLLSDEALRSQMGQSARQEADRRFRADVVAGLVREVYQRAIEDAT